MFTELLLFMRILLVLNPSIMSIITRELSCDCFTPLAFSSKNRMSLSILLCLKGGILWMLFTCLFCDFLRDLNDPLVDGLPVIVFISLIALYGQLYVWSSSFKTSSCLTLLSPLDLLESPFFRNFCSFPFQMSSSICSFRSLQSSM